MKLKALCIPAIRRTEPDAIFRRPLRAIACMHATLISLVLSDALANSDAMHATIERLSDRSQPYWVEQVASGLKFPSALVWLPNGDALVTERHGGVRVLRNGVLDPARLNGTPDSMQVGVNGLQDIVLDPDFSTTKLLYLSISEGTYEKHHAAVYRAHYSAAGLTGTERIFRSKDDIVGYSPSTSRMLFLEDKTLLIAIPENNYYKQMAQQLSSHIGKIVRISRDGSVPPDNPFLKTPGALPEIWTYGHRVQTGMYRDPDTGEILEVEPGPRGGDELNVLKAGANFGWAKESWGFDYGGGLAAPMQSGPGMESPILVWTPSLTPSGLTRYRGSVYPEWDGDYFVGHLSGKVLERVRIEGRQVVLQEKMLMDLQERFRYIRVGPDNLIYILTDNQDGRILRLQPGKPRSDQLNLVAHKVEQPMATTGWNLELLEPGDPILGKQAFLQHCVACHRVGSLILGGDIGPDLAGVYGRNAGAQPGFPYSAALANSPQSWDKFTLNFFLTDPSRYAPGTSMAISPVSDPEVRRQIVGFLKQLSGK